MIYRVPLLPYLYDRCLLQPSLPDESFELAWDGQQILIENPRRNLISRDLFLKGVWEPEVTEYIGPRVSSGMTTIDVGADTGYYTLFFAKRVGKPGRVVAFEPIPSAIDVLERNIRLNGYNNITVCNFALSSRNGSAILEAPRELSRIDMTKHTSNGNSIEIETRIFDECTTELDIRRIDLVKVDVEGAELDVLLGMRHSLEKHHPALLIEIHPHHITHFDHTVEDLLKFLETMKYSLDPVDKPSLDFTSGNITIYCT
jgi:FkbM family methyltransferase